MGSISLGGIGVTLEDTFDAHTWLYFFILVLQECFPTDGVPRRTAKTRVKHCQRFLLAARSMLQEPVNMDASREIQ